MHAQLVGGGSRGFAFRDLAVATTLTTPNLRATWGPRFLEEVQTRILRLRGFIPSFLDNSSLKGHIYLRRSSQA